jgi:hypothetical protein
MLGCILKPLLFAMISMVMWVPKAAMAFKLETHVWIAQQVLNDVISDNKVTIPPFGDFSVDPSIVAALRNFSKEYRLGSIGPDAFPDVAGGQVTVHPGLDGGFQTDDWLRWVLEGAMTPAQVAFAYGTLTHAASDIFAHTYVNTYSGDIFNLKDEQEVELRHMGLEDYIKRHNPPFRDHTGKDVGSPQNLVGTRDNLALLADFLGKRLILNGTVSAEYARENAAPYLASMYAFWRLQGDAIGIVDDILNRINGTIRGIQDKIERLRDQIDDLTDKTKRICVPVLGCKTFKIYPLSCALEPSHCMVIESTKATLRSTQRSLDPPQQLNVAIASGVKFPLEAWREDIEEAVTQYILTSLEVAQEIMKGEQGRPRDKINDWICKYGTTFAALPDGVPNAIPQLGCRVNEAVRNRIFKIKNNLKHDPLLGPVLDQIDEVKNEVFLNIATALTREDSLVVRLLKMRLKEINANALNQEFENDSSNKRLLKIPDIATRVDKEMNLTENRKTFDPERYNVVHNAIVLSKLVLLGPSELNRMVMVAGIQPTIYGLFLYSSGATPFNLLFGAVRSIDGNHQWQEVGLPYLRMPPHVDGREASERMYGYRFEEVQKGFRLWQDCEVREKVFKKIFHGPVAPEIEIPQHIASEKDPFPLSDGSKDVAKYLESQRRGSSIANRWYVCGEVPSGVEVIADERSQPVLELDKLPAVLPQLRREERRVSRLDAGTMRRFPAPPDQTPPTIQAPDDMTIECSAAGKPGQAVNLGTAVAMDDRDGQVTVSREAPDLFPLGKTLVTWRAKDSAGNESFIIQTVTVVDSVPPILARRLPHLTILSTNPEGSPIGLKPPPANDACDGPLLAATKANLNALPIGDNQVRWVARDRSGNAARVSQTISVREKESSIY